MKTIIDYVLLTALRDRLFPALILGMVLVAGVATALSGTSLVEEQEMALVISAAVIRLVVAVGLIVFVSFHVRQAFETREIDLMLSRPISRVALVFGWWLGFALVAALLVATAMGILYLVGHPSLSGFMWWGLSFLAESWIVVALSLFSALIMNSAVVSVISGLGFYILARMVGFFLATVQARLMFKGLWVNVFAKNTVEGVAMFMPRLDFFGKTEWLLYGLKTGSWHLFALQLVIYLPLLLAAAMVDFNKKQF